MPTEIFAQDLTIYTQSVKRIIYSELMDRELDIAESEISYSILRHNENERYFKVQLYLNLHILEIMVEGHYEVSKRIIKENYKKVIESVGIRTLIPFLRQSVFDITSLTKQGGVHLPLINLENLIDNQTKGTKIKRKRSTQKM